MSKFPGCSSVSKGKLRCFHLVHFFFLQVVLLLGDKLRIVVDNDSRVRESCTPVLDSSSGRKADDGASIAIWNRDKFIMVLATSLWGSNFGFLIHGTFSPL